MHPCVAIAFVATASSFHCIDLIGAARAQVFTGREDRCQVVPYARFLPISGFRRVCFQRLNHAAWTDNTAHGGKVSVATKVGAIFLFIEKNLEKTAR
jgi:hypothetical protein